MKEEHTTMKIFRRINRNIRDAFKSVIRNFSLSIASISCITITLIVVALSVVLSLNVENFTESIRKDVTVVIFLDNDVTKNEIENMNNNGKFVTYIKIKNEQWIELDGTLTKRVSSYDVIENNFGGIIIDYEISRDYKSLLEYEKKIKQFAYILIYIRKNYIDEIFCEVNLNDIHENVVIRNQQFGFSHQLFL